MGRGKQFRWTTPMSHMLLQILAEEAVKGNKPSSTFRVESLNRVANEVSKKFDSQCESKHVENHLKTLRKEWSMITKLRERSGFGWDENLKMITAEKIVYDAEVAAFPAHEDFLNKKIEMYEEKAIVVGKDLATGSYAKSFVDIDLNDDFEPDLTSMEGESMLEEATRDKDSSFTTNLLPQKKSQKKKARTSTDDIIGKMICEKLSEVAESINNLNKHQLDVFVLFEEVMKVKGIHKYTLDYVFGYLAQHESLAKSFMARNAELRKKWVEDFILKQNMDGLNTGGD